MKWACEYESSSGMIGLRIFSAEGLNAAQSFMDDMRTH